MAAATPPAPAPKHDETHPLIMQQAAQAMAVAPVGPLQPFYPPPKMPAIGGGGGGPTREVFGFALASSLTDPTVGYTTWDFSLLSTVAYFGLHVQGNGTFVFDTGSTVWSSSSLTALVTTAHANNTKVVLTIIMQDFSPGTPTMCAALANAATTINLTVIEVKGKGVDGLNIDYEGLNGSCGSTDPSWAQHHLSSFVAGMRSSLPAGSYLSVDTYASSAADTLGFFDIPALAPKVDSFFVMAYDLEYSNASRAPLNCSSFCLGPTAPLSGYYYNETSTSSQYRSVVPASQVIMGVPYYGRKSCVGPGVPNAYPTGGVVADSYLDATGESTYYLTAPGTYSIHYDANDPAGKGRWDTWLNTRLNCTRELYWDDTVALAQKYALVNRDNLRGVGLWTLNYGGGAPELWSTLRASFTCFRAMPGPTLPTAAGACSSSQYNFTGSNGTTWANVDPANLTLNFTPPADAWALISANADLWTGTAGVNQDIGIAASGGAYGGGRLVAWKESGGLAGTFSPNAGFVQTAIPVVGGTAYTAGLQWKASMATSGAIFIGAGPIGGRFSPTRFTVQLIPAAAGRVFTKSSTAQYYLTGSNGSTWQDIDATNLGVAFTPPAGNWLAFVSGNADLWTSSAGFNQDLGVTMSGGAYPTAAGQPEVWKEGGGFAGTFSPNAAFIEAGLPVVGGTAYTAKLQWKANRAGGGSIWAGAGPINGGYSPTRLTVFLVPTSPPGAVVASSALQYSLASSDGSTWQPLDTTNLKLTIVPGASSTYRISVNSDLWTTVAGYNPDIGLMISGGAYGAGTLMGWEESSGSSAYSPNAAVASTEVPLIGATTYTLWPVWKSNRPAQGVAIRAGAGPTNGRFSATWLMAVQLG